LGPLEVLRDGRPLALHGRKSRALLAALALQSRPVSAERLIDDLWGDRPPPTAKNSLHNAVSALRKTLGADAVETQSPGYALELAPGHLDIAHFERLCEEARATDGTERRAAKLQDALRLWRGPALADLAFEPFALIEAPRLEELRLAAQQDLIDAELALGRHADVLPELETLVAEHPFDERLRAQLMLALYRSGRQADALETYRATREFLVEELGLEPSPELRELQQGILGQDESLTSPAPPQASVLPVRKIVTVLFADLVDSTALAQRLDPEALRRLLERTFVTAREAVERHGGTVEQFLGDAVLAVFGIPAAHEDDALRALRAALELRDGVTGHGVDLRLRVGVNTGEVFVGGAGTSGALVTGAAVNLAKRLGEAASPGEILLGPSTLRLVRESADVEQREPLQHREDVAIGAWRLIGLVEGAPPIPRRFEAPLVGREQELASLRQAFEKARDEGRCRLVVLAGEPGIGKTRLANEFCSGLKKATILTGRCLAYGEGATWLPLVEALGHALGKSPRQRLRTLFRGDDDAARVVHAVEDLLGAGDGVDRPHSTGETFWTVRRVLERLAGRRPVVLVLEDVHWAEPTLLDLVEYLDGFGAQGPTLVLCVARAELLEERPRWGERAIALEALGDREIAALVDNLSGGEVGAAVRARVAEVAEGNPLFAEQLLAWAAEGGPLDEVPPSVEALLQSRVDRLPADSRGVLVRAAVVGREFTPSAVRALSPDDAAGALGTTLFALVRNGFLAPAAAAPPHEDGFRFHHALVRDVAYAGIPKSARADLHERTAEWLEAGREASAEVVGFHLEQAYRYREQLGPVDRHARALGDDAGRRLGDAGIRAWKRADVSSTVNLLTRATSLLPARDQFRRELLCELGIALRTGGGGERAKNVLTQAVEDAAAARDRRIELRARIELAYLALGDETDTRDALVQLAADALPVFEAVQDDRSLGRTQLLIGYVEGALRSRNDLWQESAERAIIHYQRSGWSPSSPINQLAAALLHGAIPVPVGIRRCEELLQGPLVDRSGSTNVLVILAVLKALAGTFEEARELAEETRRRYEELGQTLQAAINAGWASAQVELLAGNPAAAERVLRPACTSLRGMGENVQLSSRAAELAEALYAQGRSEDAARWAQVAEENSVPYDVSAETQWRAIRAKVLAREGRLVEAERLARDAVALIQETDALNQHAKLLLDVAEILRLATRFADATPLIEQAQTLYERKDNRVGLERTRGLLSDLTGPRASASQLEA
jgi:DNA-binding SARP family transcriptional activator